MSLIVVALYFIGRFGLGMGSSEIGLFVPILPAVLAGISVLFSLFTIIFRRNKPSYWLGLIAYVLVALTIGTLTIQTGGIGSPFVALWLITGVLVGMFGWLPWLIALLVANAYAAYYALTAPTVDIGEMIKLLLITEAPLIASYVIWHTEAKAADGSNQKAVTDLKQQLSQATTQSDIVISSIADGVVAIDSKGVIELINPAAQALLGWSKHDSIGLDYKSVIKLTDQKGDPLADDLSPIRQVVLSNKPFENDDLNLVTKSGKKIIVSLMVSPVNQDAKTSGVIAVFRDVTREKEEQRQRGEFISTASHEMRTPVAAIEGYLALAMNPQTAVIDDKARAYLQKAYESTQHLGRLFQDLLTVSKAEDARLVPRPTVIDVTAFTREISDGLQQKAKEKGIGLVFAPGGSGTDASKHVQPAFYTYADPGQLREVLSNLVDNAIKYTKQGTVTIDIKADDNNVTISVADTGIGIPPEDVPHLFQKFYRVDNSDTREIGGTGLGLYISRRLLEANNGSISVNSVYGKGSTFIVKLSRIASDKATDMMNKSAADTKAQPV